MGLLAAYQLTGRTIAREELNGPERLTALMASDRFDAGSLPATFSSWRCSNIRYLARK